jgi:hypothetical protein
MLKALGSTKVAGVGHNEPLTAGRLTQFRGMSMGRRVFEHDNAVRAQRRVSVQERLALGGGDGDHGTGAMQDPIVGTVQDTKGRATARSQVERGSDLRMEVLDPPYERNSSGPANDGGADAKNQGRSRRQDDVPIPRGPEGCESVAGGETQL